MSTIVFTSLLVAATTARTGGEYCGVQGMPVGIAHGCPAVETGGNCFEGKMAFGEVVQGFGLIACGGI